MAVWAAQQIVEAFPEDTAPRYMVRDRDGIYSELFRLPVEGRGVEEIRIAPKSPWQNCYVERLIGSIRRECLDHVIVINDRHLRRLLTEYFRYYHHSRTLLSLKKDSPESRVVQSNKAERIIQVPQLGGLHHRYERLAA
jgi:putative transposase